jgi:hypothetical protein
MKFLNLILLLIFFDINSFAKDKPKKFINQLEFGFNYMNYYNNNPNTSGWGQIKEGNSYNLNYTNILSYQLIYNEKHNFKIGLSNFESYKDFQLFYKTRKWGYTIRNILLGYSYNFYLKNFTIKPSILVNYRYIGVEGAVGEFRGNGSAEATLLTMEYNAPLGGGMGIELNYFITKKKKIWVNVNVFLLLKVIK